jgi:cytochrome c-type biogenesis protein
MDPQSVTLPLAFLAGLLSFASPCVLPLVPAYMGYLSGTAVTLEEQPGKRRQSITAFGHSTVFVLGFMAVFVVLGASATFLGSLLLDYRLLLQRVGGVLLVIFGMRLMGIGWSRRRWVVAAIVVASVTFVLHSGLLTMGRIELDEYALVWLQESLMMGLVVLAGADLGTVRQVILAAAAGILNFLASFDALVPNLIASVLIALSAVVFNRTDLFYAEKKLEFKQAGQAGYARSFLFGVVFAAGWTPCIGPILTGILVVASQLETVGQGILLLLVYSLGLGVPFLLVGMAFGTLAGWLRRMNRYVGIVSIISGVLLVLMGIFIYTDSLAFLARYGNLFDVEL